MKTSSTRKGMVYLYIIAALVLNVQNLTLRAQVVCSSPRLQFSSPTLVSGTALAEGSMYKFPNVMPGIDCFIKVRKFNGGATLVSMETAGQGYPDAWQPIVKGPGTPFGNRSWIDFRISFKTNGGLHYGFPCLDISSIDVDGDNGRIGEFVESDGHYSYEVPNPSLLVVSNLGSGRIRLQGPVTNRPSIDTSAMDVRGHFYFNGRDSIDISLGSFVYNNGYSGAAATERLNCIYFKKITGNYLVLPFQMLSFQAKTNGNAADLTWLVSSEHSGDRYHIERSVNGQNFEKIGEMYQSDVNGLEQVRYSYQDPKAGLLGRDILYYRIRRIDAEGKETLSHIVPVEWRDQTMAVQVYPNPFVSSITVQASGDAEIRLLDARGNTLQARKMTSALRSGLKMDGVDRYPAGLYMIQVIKEGKIAHTEKLIKY